jgi:hypothetical protein
LQWVAVGGAAAEHDTTGPSDINPGDTNTAQGVDSSTPHATLNIIGLPRASFGMRMGALLVDVVLVAFVLNLIYHSHPILLLEPVQSLAEGRTRNCSCVSGISCVLQVASRRWNYTKNTHVLRVRCVFLCSSALRCIP